MKKEKDLNLVRYNGLIEKEFLDIIKQEAKQEYIGFSCLINTLIKDYCKGIKNMSR